MFLYLAALVPLYIFVYLPLSQSLFGTRPRPSHHQAVVFNESFIAIDAPASCPKHDFSAKILSREPLIIYLEQFLSPDESEHLLRISEDKFEPSTVTSGQETRIDPTVRVSEVALLDRDDVVKCIEDRARVFQGWRPNLFIERLRTQRYGTGGHYVHHYDWSGGGASRGADRASTFMVYVDANCTGGGTEFPMLSKPDNDKWCDVIECEQETNGLTFKPITGNAIYWENLREDGSGYEETWHAGLPVISGSKIGLNIWSWYQFP